MLTGLRSPMGIHVIGDSIAGLSAVRAMLEQRYTVTSELLGGAGIRGDDIDAVVVSADLRLAENISALKTVSDKLCRIRKRVFLLEQRARLSVVQAYALGATHVLTHPVNKARLLDKLADRSASGRIPSKILARGLEAAMAGAACIASMFFAVSSGAPIDVRGVKNAGRKIAESIAEDGLSEWLTTVRRHHEGTYQHCLLVTGIAVDFGLSLGAGKADIERLYCAAMFHDIGKAKIPLTILDKPGHLDAEERALVETHPVAGYEMLKGNAAISPEILDAVWHHHEFLDGSGYPDALCAESISDMVRLLTIADIFAALIEQRSYKPAMPREQAYEIIRNMHGKLEMPLVAAFKDVALTR
jgi:putative nucleotidyltransferase with HDIG domain